MLAGTLLASMALLPLSSYTGFSSFSFLGLLLLAVAGVEGLLADWLLAGLPVVEVALPALLAVLLVAGFPVLEAGLLALELDWVGFPVDWLLAGFPVVEVALPALLAVLLVAGFPVDWHGIDKEFVLIGCPVQVGVVHHGRRELCAVLLLEYSVILDAGVAGVQVEDQTVGSCDRSQVVDSTLSSS